MLSVLIIVFVIVWLFNNTTQKPISTTPIFPGQNSWESDGTVRSPQVPETSTDDFLNEGNNPSSPDLKLIIKTSNLSITVEDVRQSTQDIQNLAEALGGFVVASQVTTIPRLSTTRQDLLQSTITIRVPSERFEEALTHIKSVAAKVESERITGQDVTEEYTDLNAQLGNQQRQEQRLLELFDQTETVEEILQLERELTRVRGQIEQLQGRIQYLERSAELSSITVSLTPKTEEVNLVENEWTPVIALRKAVRDLINFAQNLTDSLLYAIVFYGPFLLLGFLAWKGFRRFRPKP